MDFLQKLISYFKPQKPQPDLEFVAKQLRKPSGEFAEKIADKIDKSNYPLFEVTLKALQLKDHDHVLEIGFGSGKFYSGFRPRDSMEQFPFVEHGFNLYAVYEWQNILELNGFNVTNTFNISDPPLEAEGKIIHLSSVCMKSQKNQ